MAGNADARLETEAGPRRKRGLAVTKPLYISAFRQEDGSYNIVWSRPNRRRDAPTDTVAADDGLPPLTGAEQPAPAPAGGDGLGGSSAEGGFGGEQAPKSGRQHRTLEMAD